MGIARSGEQAIAVSQKNGYDIVFIDMKLPAISGLEASLAMEKDQSGNGGHRDDCLSPRDERAGGGGPRQWGLRLPLQGA